MNHGRVVSNTRSKKNHHHHHHRPVGTFSHNGCSTSSPTTRQSRLENPIQPSAARAKKSCGQSSERSPSAVEVLPTTAARLWGITVVLAFRYSDTTCICTWIKKRRFTVGYYFRNLFRNLPSSTRRIAGSNGAETKPGNPLYCSLIAVVHKPPLKPYEKSDPQKTPSFDFSHSLYEISLTRTPLFKKLWWSSAVTLRTLTHLPNPTLALEN